MKLKTLFGIAVAYSTFNTVNAQSLEYMHAKNQSTLDAKLSFNAAPLIISDRIRETMTDKTDFINFFDAELPLVAGVSVALEARITPDGIDYRFGPDYYREMGNKDSKQSIYLFPSKSMSASNYELAGRLKHKDKNLLVEFEGVYNTEANQHFTITRSRLLVNFWDLWIGPAIDTYSDKTVAQATPTQIQYGIAIRKEL